MSAQSASVGESETDNIDSWDTNAISPGTEVEKLNKELTAWIRISEGIKVFQTVKLLEKVSTKFLIFIRKIQERLRKLYCLG